MNQEQPAFDQPVCSKCNGKRYVQFGPDSPLMDWRGYFIRFPCYHCDMTGKEPVVANFATTDVAP